MHANGNFMYIDIDLSTHLRYFQTKLILNPYYKLFNVLSFVLWKLYQVKYFTKLCICEDVHGPNVEIQSDEIILIC